MAAGFDWKKMFGGMSPSPQAITAEQAITQRRQPWRTVTTESMTSQPYADRLLKHQWAKNAGWDPNFNPDVSGYSGEPTARRDRVAAEMIRANEEKSPWGSGAAAGAKSLAGDQEEFEYLSSELDRDFVSEAFASLSGGEPELPPAIKPPTGSQPGPGDFALLLQDPSPYKKKKKGELTLEQRGLLA